MNFFLLLIFVIHLAVAIWLYARKKDSFYLVLTAVFAILAGAVLVDSFDPQRAVASVLISSLMRKSALALTILTAVMKMGSIVQKRKAG